MSVLRGWVGASCGYCSIFVFVFRITASSGTVGWSIFLQRQVLKGRGWMGRCAGESESRACTQLHYSDKLILFWGDSCRSADQILKLALWLGKMSRESLQGIWFLKQRGVVSWLRSQGGSPMQPRLTPWDPDKKIQVVESELFSLPVVPERVMWVSVALFPASVSLSCGLSPQISVYVFSLALSTWVSCCGVLSKWLKEVVRTNNVEVETVLEYL